MEVANFHGRDDHLKGLLASGAHGGAEEAAIGGSDHFFYGGVSAVEDQIHRRFAVFVREGETVAGRRLVRSFGGGTRVDQISGNATIHKQHLLPRKPLAIEGGALLKRMINIVVDADVRSEKLLAHAFIEAGAFVFQSGGGKIVKKKADKIEDRGGFEDHRVAPGGELARVDRAVRLFAGARGKFLRVERADIRGIGFGPACGGSFLHGDGEFGVGLTISGKKAAGISQSGLALAGRINSGGDLTFLEREVADKPYGAGALFGGEFGGPFDEAVDATIALPSRHWQ